jgi:endoribonuclease Dicer
MIWVIVLSRHPTSSHHNNCVDSLQPKFAPTRSECGHPVSKSLYTSFAMHQTSPAPSPSSLAECPVASTASDHFDPGFRQHPAPQSPKPKPSQVAEGRLIYADMSVENVGDASSEDGYPPDLSLDRGNPSLLAAERKREDVAIFTEFARDRQQQQDNNHGQSAAASSRSSTLAQIGEKIISSPREYQVELFERAKEKNTIAVLDTGTGKTLIATLLLRHIIEQELIDRDDKKGPRISFFLVDKVALAEQQSQVLKINLDYPIARVCGEFVDSTSTATFWKTQFEQNMVIVCTAEILYQVLHHSFVRIDQINLLIFDEAHHAKKNHPYARIIKDFYAELEMRSQRRPRIFGMTASPIDAKTDLTTGAAQLEGLLHSEIATADPSVMQKAMETNEKYEEIITYSLPPSAFETVLWQRLNLLIGENEEFRKLLVFSREATRNLGRWCADAVWKLGLTAAEMNKIKARTERAVMSSLIEQSMAVVDAATAAVQDAHQVVEEYILPEPQLTPEYVSHKVIALFEILQKYFDAERDKCIIFVEQRLTGRMLVELIERLRADICGVRPGTLVSRSFLLFKQS